MREVQIPVTGGIVAGDFVLPKNAKAVVIFAHGSGSSRKSTRNRKVAEALQEQGFATLLFDLLTEAEAENRKNVFDTELLAGRLTLAKAWVQMEYWNLPIAYFGASTGAAAALRAVAEDPKGVFTVISRGGRPDLALSLLDKVKIPVLLLVGGEDIPVIPLNQEALDRLMEGRMEIVPGASHLFEEPGAMEVVMKRTISWLTAQLPNKEKNMEKQDNPQQCERCGNYYHNTFDITMNGQKHIFDSFECAVFALAPRCDHCGTPILGHGTESNGRYFCCAHCERMGLRHLQERVG